MWVCQKTRVYIKKSQFETGNYVLNHKPTWCFQPFTDWYYTIPATHWWVGTMIYYLMPTFEDIGRHPQIRDLCYWFAYYKCIYIIIYTVYIYIHTCSYNIYIYICTYMYTFIQCKVNVSTISPYDWFYCPSFSGLSGDRSSSTFLRRRLIHCHGSQRRQRDPGALPRMPGCFAINSWLRTELSTVL